MAARESVQKALLPYLIASGLLLALLLVLNYTAPALLSLPVEWIIVGALPLLIGLFATGAIRKAKVGSGGFELEGFAEASLSQNQVRALVPDEEARTVGLEAAAKAAPHRIWDLVEQRVNTLTITVGRTGYYAYEALQAYLDELTTRGSLQYVVFLDEQNRYRGLVGALDFRMHLEANRRNPDLVVAQIEEERIEEIPGVITVSVPEGVSQLEALRTIRDSGAWVVPVLDAGEQVTGVISKEDLLIDIVAAYKEATLSQSS